MDSSYSGEAFRRRSIDGADAPVRHGGADELCVQHAWQLHIAGVLGATRDFQVSVVTGNWFADHLEFGIRWQRGRLVGRDRTFHLSHAGAGDADLELFLARLFHWRRRRLRCLLHGLGFLLDAFGGRFVLLLRDHGHASFFPPAFATARVASKTLG